MSGRTRRADVAFAAAACIALAGYNNLAGVLPWHRRWYPAVNALAAAATLAAAAASGLTPADLGLRRDRLRAGLRLGSAAAAPVVAAFGLAALTPATRPLLNDQRIAGLDRRQLAYQVLLRIPVGTVAWEEIAFRGVLQAALRRVLAEPAATAVGSAVFGLWHIRPTAEALAVNRLAAGRGARITAVTARRGRDRGGGRAAVPCCGNAPAAWPRRSCCTWPPTARPRWPAPWPDLPTTGLPTTGLRRPARSASSRPPLWRRANARKIAGGSLTSLLRASALTRSWHAPT